MRWLSVFCCTIGPRASSRARSDVTVAQMTPDVCCRKKAIDSRRGELGRHDQVALVLAVLVVDDDDDLATTDGGDGVVDARQRVTLTGMPSRRAAARRTWRSRRPPG